MDTAAPLSCVLRGQSRLSTLKPDHLLPLPSLCPNQQSRAAFYSVVFWPGILFIPGGNRPYRVSHPLFPKTRPLKAEAVASLLDFLLLSMMVKCPLNAPSLPLDAFRPYSPVLTSNIHDQTSPDTQGPGLLLTVRSKA